MTIKLLDAAKKVGVFLGRGSVVMCAAGGGLRG